MTRRPSLIIKLNPASTYHSILIKKYGEEKALKELQQHQIDQIFFDQALVKAVRAYGSEGKIGQRHWKMAGLA